MSQESKNQTIYDRVNGFFDQANYKKVLSIEGRVNIYLLQKNTSLYYLNLINLGDTSKFEVKDHKKIIDLLGQTGTLAGIDKVVLVNIVFADKISESDIGLKEFNPDDKLIESFWFVDTIEEKLIKPKSQLQKISNFAKIIERLLEKKDQKHYQVKKISDRHPITISLIIINVIIWIITEINGGSENLDVLLSYGAMKVEYVINYKEYYRIFTSIFLHYGGMHLLHNCFSLYIFGSRLEHYLRRSEFLFIYFLSGIGGNLFAMGLDIIKNRTNIVSVGASGSIYGIMGAVFIYSLVGRKALEGLNSYLLILIFMVGIAYGLLTPEISTPAHIGGAICGIIASIPFLYVRQRTYKAENL